MVFIQENGEELKNFYQSQVTTFFYIEEKKEWLATYDVSQADWNEETEDWGKPLRAQISVTSPKFEDANELVVKHFMDYMEDIGWNLLNDVEGSPYLVKEI